MGERRITVRIQRFRDRPALQLQWIDADGVRRTRSAGTADDAQAEAARQALELELSAEAAAIAADPADAQTATDDGAGERVDRARSARRQPDRVADRPSAEKADVTEPAAGQADAEAWVRKWSVVWDAMPKDEQAALIAEARASMPLFASLDLGPEDFEVLRVCWRILEARAARAAGLNDAAERTPSLPEKPGCLLLSPRKAAEALDISERKLRYLAKAGEIPSVPIGNRIVRYDWEDLKAWICRQKRT